MTSQVITDLVPLCAAGINLFVVTGKMLIDQLGIKQVDCWLNEKISPDGDYVY